MNMNRWAAHVIASVILRAAHLLGRSGGSGSAGPRWARWT